MISGKKVLAVIPARGGSKGVPRKNIRPLAGKPLIVWTIEAAKKSKYIDRLVLSSEDAEITSVAKRFGCEVPFVRPKELARDNASGVDTLVHAVEALPGYDYAVLLQPTSPLRTPMDIDGCIEMCERKRSKTCVSVMESEKSPYWMYTISDSGKMRRLLTHRKTPSCRQDLPKVYVLNGAVYVVDSKYLLKKKLLITKDTVPYLMGNMASIDIDTEDDFSLAEYIVKKI